jgi:hypothetical protein
VKRVKNEKHTYKRETILVDKLNKESLTRDVKRVRIEREFCECKLEKKVYIGEKCSYAQRKCNDRRLVVFT